MKDKTTITIERDTWKDLMLFKIKTDAKNLDAVIKDVIKRLKEEIGENDRRDSQ